MREQVQRQAVWGRVALLLVLSVVGAWAHGRAMPLLEGGDEWLQFAYVEHLRTTGTLPDRTATDSPIRQQSGQPPLTYAVSALPSLLLRLPPADTVALYNTLQRERNFWFTPPNRFDRQDNNNVFVLTNAALDLDGVRVGVRAARWIAPLYGVFGTLAMLGAAWEVFRRWGWALCAAALYALMPMMLHINGFLTTDGGAAALGTGVLWLALRVLRRGLSVRRSLLLGVLIGLAGLAKVSAGLVAVAAGVALMWHARRRLGVWALHGVLMALPVALTFGVWVAWGALTYNDPLGTGTHRFEGQYFDPPLPPAQVIARLPEVYLSYWGKFASAVYLHPYTYALLTALMLLALAGYLAPRTTGARLWGVRLLIGAAAVSVGAGLLYWLATINFITGRLLLPANGAFVLIVIGGVRRAAVWRPAWGVMLRALVVVPSAVVGVVIAPLALYEAYSPPTPAAPPVTLTPTHIDFDATMRLWGWHAPEVALVNGTPLPVTLCWQVLATPTRPAAYSLKLVRDGISAGERTTLHGLGRYDWRQWTVGARFCEVLSVPIDAAQPNTRYDLLLVMLDAQTGAVDWAAADANGTPIAFPVLGSR